MFDLGQGHDEGLGVFMHMSHTAKPRALGSLAIRDSDVEIGTT